MYMAGTLASCKPGVLKKRFVFSSLSKWAHGWRLEGFTGTEILKMMVSRAAKTVKW